MTTVGFMGGKFLPFHLGHLYAFITASNLVDKLYIVLSYSKKRDMELCLRDGIKYMPGEVRATWLGEAFNDIPNIEIITIEDDEWDNNYNWEAGVAKIRQAIPERLTHVFSSENDYTTFFERFYPEAKHIIIDNGRNTVNISATKLRNNIYEYWHFLPKFVRAFFTKKVAIVGTESTGKSTLTTMLAKFYNTAFVHEVGRDYCEKYKNQLIPSMFESIAMEHYILQEKLIHKSNKLMLIDSDAIITEYYMDMYCGAHSLLINEIIAKQDYDLVLYLEPDVEWVADGFRFSGANEQRLRNNKKLKQMYVDYGVNIVPISGNYSNRFFTAQREIDSLFN